MHNRHSNQSRISVMESFYFENVMYENVVKEVNPNPIRPLDLILSYSQQSDRIIKSLSAFRQSMTKVIQNFLNPPKITLTAVPSDGNCFCHGITKGLKDTIKVSADTMMNVIVDYALEHPIDGVPFKYEPTCPDTEPLARAASLLYKINIVIINLDTRLPLVYFNENAIDSVFLFNMNGHYWLVNIDFTYPVDLKLMRLKIATHFNELQLAR